MKMNDLSVPDAWSIFSPENPVDQEGGETCLRTCGLLDWLSQATHMQGFNNSIVCAFMAQMIMVMRAAERRQKPQIGAVREGSWKKRL